MVILLACLISEKLTGKLKQFNIEWPSLEDFNVGTSTATELLPAPKTSDNTAQHQLTQTKNGDVSVKSTTKNITLTPTSQHSTQDTNAESRSCINQTDQNGSDRLRTPNIQSHHLTNSAGAPEDGAPAASNDDNNDSDDSDVTRWSGGSDWLMDDSNFEEVDIVYGSTYI